MTNSSYASRSYPASFDAGEFMPRLAAAADNDIQRMLLPALSQAASHEDWLRVYGAHMKWGRMAQGKTLAAPLPQAVQPFDVLGQSAGDQLGRRLRIGFLSGGLHNHPVGRCCQAFFKHYQREVLEVFALSTHTTNDWLEQNIRANLPEDHFVDLTDMETLAAAQTIAALNLDVLVDLDGHHMSSNTLEILAYPGIARVRTSYLGYAATTGLPLDAWMIDQRCLPDDNGDYFTERDLVGLPIGFCLEGYDLNCQQSALPALRNGFITFGTLNNPNKWCPQTLTNWAALLQDNPTAKLLLGRPECDNPLFVQQWQNRFAERGIDADRLIFAGNPEGGYLKLYERIDIAVDTYGNTGGMTSLEALACGVPVLSMGHPDGARQPVNLLSTAILQHVGLADEWLLDNVNAFVAQAARYSNDLQSLATLRQTLPQQLTNSALYNGRAYASGLSDALIALADRCRVAQINSYQTRVSKSAVR